MHHKNIHGASAISCYENLFHHLSDELSLLNLRLLRELRIRQKTDKNDYNNTKGFFISKEEVVSILSSPEKGDSDSPDTPEIESINSLIERVRDDIARKLSNTENNAVFPLLRLAGTFGLMPFEVGVLIMALASEIDSKYERVYAYFNDDLTKKAPSVSLALDILCSNPEDRLRCCRFFYPDAPLVYFGIIHFIDDHGDGAFLSRRFRLDERIKRYLIGNSGLPSNLLNIAQIYYPGGNPPDTFVQKDIKEKISKVLVNRDNTNRSVFWLYGTANEEKKAVVLEICEEFSLPVLIADLKDISLETEQRSIIKSLFREAALQSAMVFLDGGACLYAADEKAELLKRALLASIGEISGITFINADVMWMPENSDGKYQWYPFEFRLPTYAERKAIWLNALNGSGIPESDIDTISGRFNFSRGQIRNAVLHARQFSNGDGLTLDGIYTACSIQTHQGLNAYSRKVAHHYTWDDIVLPEDKVRHLKEICAYIRYKHLVYFKWGFEKKLALGKGLNILFSGPSGTGKTMAADIIAAELRLEMYKVDLSSIVSKYIGETEKNLNRVFNDTSSGNAILFFDEADALFGKRSEVKDAHDRYANIEINYLLQKMEEHEGIVILATNLSRNMDQAFLRRMHFTVEFPFPEKQYRLQIWKKMYPEEVPLSDDIDFEFLAERLQIAGGNIKNIVLNSGVYAAADGSHVRMKHIIKAAAREFQKMGKLCTKSEFGEYFNYVEEMLQKNG
ncbi:MAG: ATP-binding protein [Deferribacteres bacterium]|nr:ATP-binding protein [Deferribacteres bacterium]